MIGNYRCFTLSIQKDENVVQTIYKQLQSEGTHITNFNLKFVGFEASAGLAFKLNDHDMKVPQSGKFITPYNDSSDYIAIKSLSFNNNLVMDIYCIY